MIITIKIGRNPPPSLLYLSFLSLHHSYHYTLDLLPIFFIQSLGAWSRLRAWAFSDAVQVRAF